jgi:hypothetical protein
VNAEQFCSDFDASGKQARPIESVMAKWESEKSSRIAEDYLGFEAFLALLIADANVGDGLLDQISPELLAAFTARRGQNFDSYDEVRSYLKEMLDHGDHSVTGVVSQIKGQVGELVFRDQAGGYAYLASSTNQEAWDVAIPHATKATEYVQVKIYHSADEAVKMMQEVSSKVDANMISDGGKSVNHINFAVNEDIAAAVREKAAQHPELLGMKVYSIPLSNADATGTVVDGFNNVGPDELVHLFNEWFAGSVSAACLHGMANAFLVYKGSKTMAAAMETTAVSSAISAPGIAAAQVAAWLSTNTKIALLSGHPVIAAVTAGMLVRAVAKSWYESRETVLSVIQRETNHNETLVRALTATGYN